jgi:hypothetical protein
VKDEPHPFNVIRSVRSDCKHLCILIDAHNLYKITNICGKAVQFRSFQTKLALMCKIQEHDKVSVLKRVLCIIFDFIVRQSTTNLMYDKVLKLYS